MERHRELWSHPPEVDLISVELDDRSPPERRPGFYPIPLGQRSGCSFQPVLLARPAPELRKGFRNAVQTSW